MTRSIVLIAVMMFASQVVAQTSKTSPTQKSKPEIGGRWILESSEERNGASVKPANETVLVVKQEEPEVRFVESTVGQHERELNYFTDGRGEENSPGLNVNTANQIDDSTQENAKIKSKTKWDGNKLIARSQQQFVANGKIYVEDVVKEWRLSADGNTLTITTHSTVRVPYTVSNVAVAPTRGAGTRGREVTPRMYDASPNYNSQKTATGPDWRGSDSISRLKLVYRRDLAGTKK